MRRVLPILWCAVSISSLAATPAGAAGSFDPTFRPRFTLLAVGAGFAAGPAGTLYTGSSAVVTRVRRDGTADERFGGRGFVRIDAPPISVARTLEGDLVAARSGGVVTATGWFRYVPLRFELQLARFDARGRLDPSFGTGGQALFTDWRVKRLLPAPDGGVYAVVLVGPFSGTSVDAIVKIDSHGSLDRSFGRDGALMLDGTDLEAVASSGSDLLVAGGDTGDRLLLGRFHADGRPAAGFGPSGMRVVGSGNALSLAVQPDGRVLVGGTGSRDGSQTRVWRFLPDGRPDPSFGIGGRGVYGSGGRTVDLHVLPDGRILALALLARGLGSTTPHGPLLRLLPNGRRDFRLRAPAVADPNRPYGGSSEVVAVGLAPSGDGRVTVAGYGAQYDRGDYPGIAPFLVRYLSGDAAVTVEPRRTTVPGRSARLRLRCLAPRGTPCRGALRITFTRRIAGRLLRLNAGGRTLALGRGGPVWRHVALSAAARRELGARGRLAVMVETTVRDRAGYVDIRRIGITLRPG